MHDRRSASRPLQRRELLRHLGATLPLAALGHLIGGGRLDAGRARANDGAGDSAGDAEQAGAPQDLAPRPPHHPPRARAVIQLFMNGGPSQMDLFDPKPELDRRHGEDYFAQIAGEVEFPEAAGSLMRSPFKFAQHGESGMWVSDALPHLAAQVDRLALIRSLHTTNLTHEPALYKIHSGSEFIGRPSLGAWVTYGLGTENQSLPAYVVLDDPLGLPVNGIDNWTAGYLPPQYQGTRFRAQGSPVLDLRAEDEASEGIAQLELELLGKLDRLHRDARPGEPRLQARIASYELAARMQIEASDALDLSQETAATLSRYGIDEPVTESYGRRCLIARRLVERGVRFVQLFINSQIWDNHGQLASSLRDACRRTDKPVAGLLEDLAQRGLLDETLVLWGGEMGRLPIAQLPGNKDASQAGRDHNKNAVCAWMAGGGVRGGLTWGATDELGFAAVEGRVSVEDWHATVLHLLGLDHHGLFVRRNGLDERLTGVTSPRIVRELFA